MTARPDEVVAWSCALGIRVAVIDDDGEPKLTFNGSGIPPGVSLFHQDHVQKLNDYIKKMDGIIEEVGGVTASCINPYEDLKRALTTQKDRAINAEAALQSANARLAAVLALADEWEQRVSKVSLAHQILMDECATELRRAAAGEGDANQGDGE